MSKVTSVEPQKKNLKRFNVYLDGEFAFGADEDLVVNRRLVVGKIFSQKDLEKFLFEAEVGKLMERMYHWFSLRQHSEKEVRDYFKNKNLKLKIQNGEEISQLAIEVLIDKLKEKELVNDRHFAQAWVDARRKSKQKGIRAIKAELFQKGIEKEIIETIENGEWTIENEEQLAKQALEKKMKNWKNLSPQQFIQKAFEFLSRKGFEYDVVKEIIEKFREKE